MKKIKIIILLMGLQLIINAQPYVPMPTTKAVWTMLTTSFGGPAGSFKYGMYGDTIINTVSYKKIYENWGFNFNVAASNTYYRGAIREFGKKVYKVNPGTTIEGILYDFNLAIGDTARSIDLYGNVLKKKITGFNFIVYNGIMHRKWILQGGEYWLEGIGSSYGLFNSLSQGFDWCSTLVCMSIDGTVQYNTTTLGCNNATSPYNCDGGFVGINELLIDNSRSIIFPNPFSSSAILKTTIELNDATLKIFDILGQEVLTHNHLNGQEIKIMKGNLNSGNYNYHLSQNGSLISKGKFIVE
jgi:hypothetical protein